MLKIENKFIKAKKTNSEEERLLNEIVDAEKEKAKIFMEMGILLYKKIREQAIEDQSFEEMSNTLVSLDKLIYENRLSLDEHIDEKKEIECECGNIIGIDSKFCSKCGKMIELQATKEIVECISCGVEIDANSKYCICCGSKLNNQIYVDEN